MLKHTKREIAKKRGIAIVAPMWTDSTAERGVVSYQIYDMTKPGATPTEQARVKVSYLQFHSQLQMAHRQLTFLKASF